MYAKHFKPNGEPRLYKMYFLYNCLHCGYKGINRGTPEYARCQNPGCGEPVEFIDYKSMEEQEAEWAKEDKGIAGEYV